MSFLAKTTALKKIKTDWKKITQMEEVSFLTKAAEEGRLISMLYASK